MGNDFILGSGEEQETTLSAGMGSYDGESTFTVGVQYTEEGKYSDYEFTAGAELGYSFTSNQLSSADISASVTNPYKEVFPFLGVNGHIQNNGKETVTTAGVTAGLSIKNDWSDMASFEVSPYATAGYGYSTEKGSGVMYGGGVEAYKTVGNHVTLGGQIGYNNYNKWGGGLSIGYSF